MIHNYTIMGFWFNIFISIILPFVAVITLMVRRVVSLPAVLSGGATFFLAQMVFISPILSFIQKQSWFATLATSGTMIVYMILIAFLTAIVVELTRYVSVKFTIGKKFINFGNVLGFAFGFVCLESLILIGITSAQNLYYSFIINNGQIAILEAQVGVEAASIILKNLQGIDGDTLFRMGSERVLMTIVQTFLTSFVFLALKFQMNKFLYIAIVSHVVINIATSIITMMFSPFLSLVVLAVCAIGCFGFLMDIPKVFAGQGIPIEKLENSPKKKKK